ncbi:hypothetical protein [Streptomyces sp. NPDC001568]
MPTGPSTTGAGVRRHPVRFKRLRLDASVEDVPGFGPGPAAAAG